VTAQNTVINLSEISPLHTAKKETNEKNDEMYEAIPLLDTKNIEENYSSKCQSCCIPLTIDIREKKCRERIFIGLGMAWGITAASAMATFFIWIITNPESWTCYNRTHLPPCWNY
jgi:hypothetical protein